MREIIRAQIERAYQREQGQVDADCQSGQLTAKEYIDATRKLERQAREDEREALEREWFENGDWR